MLTKLMSTMTTRSFKPFRFYGEYSNQLDFENLDSLGLYVHIPFCKSICSFCPYSKQLYDPKIAQKYKVALLQEIKLVTKSMSHKKAVSSLYFGGGTPSLFIADIKEIIQTLQQSFDITDGVGVELHPNDITPTVLQTLIDSGVTMVSVGFQSFQDSILQHIGRQENDFIEKLQLISTYPFDVIDVDLIFAIPGQTNELLEQDMNIAFSNGATQVSTYPFIDFTFTNNKYKPMSKKKKKEMLFHLQQIATKNGLDRTSVWTFAKQGTQKYSSVTRDHFLGFGTSATTLLGSSFKINTFDITEYIKRVESNQLPTSLTLQFTLRQRAVYYLFWSAYGMDIHTKQYHSLIGKDIHRMYRFELWIARMLGYIKQTEYGYRLTTKGATIYHSIEQTYTHAYIDKMWNISRLEPFPKQITLL